MRIRSKTGLLAFALVASALARAQAQPGAERFQKLPKPWSVSAHVAVPDAQLPAFGQKLGAAIVRLTNTTLVADGQQLKVNIVECKTEDDAAKVQAGFLRLHNNLAVTCPREGKSVIEFVAKDLAIIERAYTELGFKAPKVVYEISFRAAPIEKCDYMAWNKLFNAFLAPTRDEGLIRDLSQSFTFGDALRLRNSGQGADRSTFTFNPLPRESKADASGEITTHTFADLPRSVAVPEVGISAVIASEAFAITPTRRRSGPELTEANSFWPATDPQIVALASKITEGKSTPREKADAVLQWLKPGSNLRYAGDITGSRYGVAAVLKQGYGHCWDFSDCFVTLCRAAGVPCRQVLGWLHGTSGHVWAEVLLEGQGWRQVDPTAGNDDEREHARKLLAARLARMTEKTLQGKLQSEDDEVVLAAIAAGVERERQGVSGELIELLTHANSQIAEAAHRALKKLSEQDFGPAAGASRVNLFVAQQKWRKWWEANKPKEN